MPVRVFGCGIGRTGTTSFKQALNILGLGPVYAFRDMVSEAHRATHPRLWIEIYEKCMLHQGEMSRTDWDSMLEGYRSTCNDPSSYFFKSLWECYPDARFVLTVRDEDLWYKSVQNTLLKQYAGFKKNDNPQWCEINRLQQLLRGDVLWNAEAAKQHFREHNEAVQRLIEPASLLVYNVQQGWEPLCQFLSVPVPDVPFPHVNSTRQFQDALPALLGEE
jgi:hypothetical protein